MILLNEIYCINYNFDFFLCNISHANEASINNVANISNKQLNQQIYIESLGLDDIDDNNKEEKIMKIT